MAQRFIWQVRKSTMLVRTQWPEGNQPDEMRYARIFIPLDADTILPREGANRLISTLAHP